MKQVFEQFYEAANQEGVGSLLDDTIKKLDRCGLSSVSERMKHIRKFADTHPGYPFISRAKVRHLCEKYGLSMGHLSYYRGSIPLKNLNEICAFLDKHPTIKLYDLGNERDVVDHLQICAPPHDLEEDANDALDPIVLLDVPDGYLIITAWGPESFDPIITNTQI